MKPNTRLLLAALLLSPAAARAGSEHPLFEAYPRSTVEKNETKEYDEYDLPVSQLQDGRHVKVQELEGRFTKLHYRNPAERSTLELMRNYEGALKQSGFTPLYACKGRTCGNGCIEDKAFGHYCVGDDLRLWSGRNAAGARVAVLVTRDETRVAIVEPKEMDNAISAAAREAAPEATGALAKPRAEDDEAPAPPTPGAAKEVTGGVIQGLGKLGMQARVGSGAGASADIIVEGTTETRPVDSAGDKRWKFARSTASITLKDGQTGRAFLSFEASDRQASGDFKEAARRSRVELAKKVADQVHSAITEYFENQ